MNPGKREIEARLTPVTWTAVGADPQSSVISRQVALAGAMGEPAWLMLPFAPDWRWLLNRSESPWYPTLYLFRQPKPGRWDLVVSKIKRELARGFTVGPSPPRALKNVMPSAIVAAASSFGSPTGHAVVGLVA